MPRNRAGTAREEKIAQLLDAADALFAEQGFAGTTTAQIAKKCAVSEKTLFWYFPSKDHILVAVTERALRLVLHNLYVGGWPTGKPEKDLIAAIKALRDIRHLLTAAQQRAEVSPVVAKARDQFREHNVRTLGNNLRALGAPPQKLGAWVTIMTCFIDGVLLRNMADGELERVCRTLFASLAPGAAKPQRVE
ncbi:MAG: TetR/AcrR family transcriptional regulator [Alphaproteobacteria bacterium]|nr:TetR/AcrR family transcriptional regulator [Alphaproteobacteria bacterium]